MPNWAYTRYFITSKKEEDVKSLHKTMKELEERKEPLVENDFGKRWLGCLVEALGKKWKDFQCRGNWDGLELNGNTLYFTTETAWYRCHEVEDLIKEKFPSLEIYWYVEECGLEIYETNDAKGKFFPERFVVDTYDEKEGYSEEYFETKEEILKYASEYFHKEFQNLDELSSFVKEINSDCNIDSHFYIIEIQIK